MKILRTLPRFVWVLLGLLAISAGILSVGQRDMEADPSVLSFSPSGVSAFGAVLQKAGYSVRVDTRSQPRLAPDEVAIAFHVDDFPQWNGKERQDALESFAQEIRRGTRGVLVRIPYNFIRNSQGLLAGEPSAIETGSYEEPLKVYTTESGTSDESVIPDLSTEEPSVGLWKQVSTGSPATGEYLSNPASVRAIQLDKGQLLEVSNGSFLTNRFLDRADDAKAGLKLVSMLAPPGSKLVFTESTIGNIEDPGLIETIGGWALAGWRQLLVLGLVVIYTLGKRFGLPDETRPFQRGARELLDGLTDTYLRGRHVKAAMGTTLDRTNQELRSALRLPRDATRAERDELLPPKLRTALSRLQTAYESEDKISAQETLKLVADVRAEANEFIRGTRLRPESACLG